MRTSAVRFVLEATHGAPESRVYGFMLNMPCGLGTEPGEP